MSDLDEGRTPSAPLPPTLSKLAEFERLSIDFAVAELIGGVPDSKDADVERALYVWLLSQDVRAVLRTLYRAGSLAENIRVRPSLKKVAPKRTFFRK